MTISAVNRWCCKVCHPRGAVRYKRTPFRSTRASNLPPKRICTSSTTTHLTTYFCCLGSTPARGLRRARADRASQYGVYVWPHVHVWLRVYARDTRPSTETPYVWKVTCSFMITTTLHAGHALLARLLPPVLVSLRVCHCAEHLLRRVISPAHMVKTIEFESI